MKDPIQRAAKTGKILAYVDGVLTDFTVASMLLASMGRQFVLGKKLALEPNKCFSLRPCFWSVLPFNRCEKSVSLAFKLSSLMLGLVLAPGAALAQCNTNSNPPALPPQQWTLKNQSFGPPPLTYYVIESRGASGCKGDDGYFEHPSGFVGAPGQPSGPIDSTNSALTITGGGIPNRDSLTFGASIYSVGGEGGAGGNGAYVSNDDYRGGDGGVGGAGARVTVRFDGNLIANPKTGLASFGPTAASLGGNGGNGGDSGYNGIFERVAGNGSQGGAAGAAAMVVSGAIRAEVVGTGVQSVGGYGGRGGNAFTSNFNDTNNGGRGGDGGQAGTAFMQWLSGTAESAQFGVRATADGGRGGDGGTAGYSFYDSVGGDAGAGGKGGQANVLLSSGGITVNLGGNSGTGIVASSNGGDGGDGGTSGKDGVYAAGGTGGTGGAGGASSVTVLGTVTFVGADDSKRQSGQGILVQANGGTGGKGANASALVGQAGGGGSAGAGGSVTLTLGNAASPATVRTSGNFAHGALVQSVGGGGGAGGQASFNAQGGAGAAGGNGGAVAVDAPNGSVIATGANSSGLLTQSVGGGGGAGGDTNSIAIGFNVAIGGNGGLGGNGGNVRVNLAQGIFASTSRLGGSGILAQSIGGSGGSGGSANSVGSSIFAMTIGGDGKPGGSGGPVSVTNDALITTWGDHASGVQAQSIGGGGGKGGAATTFNVGIVAAASVAVGGRGGGGGPASDVSVTNAGQVATYGADATGVLIQSIGGGGGSGGAAAARAIAVSPDPEVPAISLAVSLGGKGGAGNTAGAANLKNSGLITTAGDGAIAVIAQSIGGGGGAGGDSTAASYSNGASQKAGINISIAVAVGGSGGTGGTGSDVAVGNSGVIATLGQDAYGVFAQSVGGGGGTGGAGDASASAGSGKSSFGAAVSVGGSGGTGGHGGPVSMTNSGAVTTRGDGADGVFAQSIGGGGGAGGGGVAHAGGGTVSIAVGVGGSGGAGGDGNTATVTNSGSVITRGTDAIGISVQSIGGGGGKGGKGGATAGGASPFSNAKALYDLLAGGLNFGPKATQIGDDILLFGKFGEQVKATYDELNSIFSQPQADDANKGTAVKINVSVSVGGSGGAAGHGGAANANNTGQIATLGAQSDGIYAQSVGGGGGSGGAATSASAAADDTPVQTAVAVGGTGGAAGDGGPVTVVNATGGTIRTEGVLAFGILGQSVGGGGGEASVAGAVSGSLKSLSVGVGGNGGKGGDGGAVSVTTSTAGSITTTGKHGIGIYAQSIGGGGGLVRSMTTDQTFDPSKIAINPQGRVADVQGVSLTLGGLNGSSGKGGEVLVTTGGLVTTSGLDAHAVLAQSIGGGGGMAVGGQILIPPSGNGGPGGASGDGGSVTLRLRPGTGIETSGDGAHGILAQSIGGGGGAAGDFSYVASYQADTPNVVKSNTGNGGAVTITADSTLIHTSGKYAPAIFAQSIGGGGGLVNYSYDDGARAFVQARGTAGGQGSGGTVTVSIAATRVFAEGVGSAGLLVQSEGTASGSIRISIDSASEVRGGLPDPNFQTNQAGNERDAAAIRLLGGTGNQIDNAGSIKALGDVTKAFAILADTTPGNIVVNNTGTITGNIFLGNSRANLVENQAGGVINAPVTINLGGGVLRNAGTLHVGGAGAIGTTVLTGNLVQSGSGIIRVDVDARNGQADLLAVTGTATLAGIVLVNPVSLRKSVSGSVITAAEGIFGTPVVQGPPSPIFSQSGTVVGNTLTITTNADFGSGNAAASTAQRSLASHLQRVWDSGSPEFDQGFAILGSVATPQAYAETLDALSGQEVAAVASSRYEASQNFARDAFSCRMSAGSIDAGAGNSCVWARAAGVVIDHGASGGFPAYRWRATSVKMGGQSEVQPNLFVAGALGYESGWLNDSDSRARANTETGLGLVALRYQPGGWTIDGMIDVALGSINLRRNLAQAGLGTASSASQAFNAGVHLRTAYTVSVTTLYVEPAVELDANYVRINGYTENGAAPFNLKVNALEDVVLAATPDLRVGSRFGLGPQTAAKVYVGGGISFLHGNKFEVDSRFASISNATSSFRSTFNNDNVVGRFTAGIDIQTIAGIDLSIQYQGRHSRNQNEHGGQARLAYRF
jgi:hypothetical protein